MKQFVKISLQYNFQTSRFTLCNYGRLLLRQIPHSEERKEDALIDGEDQILYGDLHDLNLITFLTQNILPRLCNPLRARTYQPTLGLTSTCPQKDVKDHPTTLGVSCDQHVDSPSHYSICRPELPLKNRSYPNSSRWSISSDTSCQRSNLEPTSRGYYRDGHIGHVVDGVPKKYFGYEINRAFNICRLQ